VSKPLLLTFDLEEFDLPRELGQPISPRRQVEVTDDGLQLLLPTLAAHDVRATFFVTGRFARARPERMRGLCAAGHEVGVHGLLHRDDYRRMEHRLAVRRLVRARELVERVIGQPVAGVRMPHLLPCPPARLAEAGFRYDATPHPTWIPGRYRGLHWPRVSLAGGRHPARAHLRLARLPPSRFVALVSPVRRPGTMMIRLAAAQAPYLQVYFHPWEAVSVQAYGVPAWIAWRTGPVFVRALDRLLAATKGFCPMPVGDFVDSEAPMAFPHLAAKAI
jgi:peptidoglycan/xylan/chitin deacetylase (PgdA/CDA1 family)